MQRLETQLGNSFSNLIESLNRLPFVSIRLNPLKPCNSHVQLGETIPWCEQGRYLPEKPLFTLDPLFHAGCYYPQEPSSMIIDWIARSACKLTEHPRVLDLCAAPGGKSTLLATLLGGKGLLVANEVIKNRAPVLEENLVKWGVPNCIVTRNDPSDFASLVSFFDLILVDAPCSGEGMFRKHPRAVSEWSELNAQVCAKRQQRILTDVWPGLKEGGYLIYSTCTFNPAENEDNVAWLARETGADVLALEAPEAWRVKNIAVASGNGLALYPHLARGEGFFVAVLQKTFSRNETSPILKNPKIYKTATRLHALDNLLQPTWNWAYSEHENLLHAFPKEFDNELSALQNKLNVKRYGIKVGKFIKNILVPDQALALSTSLNHQLFAKQELSKQQALLYLKGETITPGNASVKGYILVTYQDIPLGFAKNIGTRMNNMYPSGWRIRIPLP